MSEIVDCITWIVRKTCWSFYVCCEFIFLRILDLFGLFFNILACLTIIRLPCMIRQFAIMNSISEWRSVGFLHWLIFLMDIPIISMAFFVFAFSFGLIFFPMKRDIDKKRVKCDYTHKNDNDLYFGGFELRKLVVSYFFKHLTGMICFPLLLITLLSWRSVILIRKLRELSYFKWGWRKVIIFQFLQLFVDLPCVFVGFFVVISWRLPFYLSDVKKIREDHGWYRWRFVAFKHFFLLFVDIFCFLLFIFIMLTWRLPLAIKELRSDSCYNHWAARIIIVKQFLLIFVDIPCILCFLVVVVTVWRLPRFKRNLTKDERKIRENCVYQAGMLLVDFACFLIFGIVLLTLWRFYPLIKDIRKYKKRATPDAALAGESVPQSCDNVQEMNVVSRTSSWKIRKAICKHFLFLVIDIPAVLISMCVLVTMFRLPSLLSKLLQSGDFYAEFAMIVFMEVGKLLVDIVFVFFFLLLVILRPIAAWVHILEDDEHRQYRHVCFHMKWIPDMIKEIRGKLPVALDEEFSLCLKDGVNIVQARTRMSLLCQPYLQQWNLLRVRLVDIDVYPELEHLIATVLWYEGRRPYKTSRLYACERAYLSRPIPNVHNENIAKYKQEMVDYERKLSSIYNDLEKYIPAKVPLWGSKSGLFTRSRQETQHVLLALPGGNIIYFILILINLLFIYRAPKLVVDLCNRWYDRRSIILRSFKEYLLDGLTFLRILIIMLFVYRAPALFLDITTDVFQKRSWTAVRATAKRYPLMIMEDVKGVINTILNWRTVRFLFTAFLFGILIPADILLTVFKLSFHKKTAYLLSGIVFVIYVGFPFALAFHFAEVLQKDGFGINIPYIIGGYGLSFVVMLVVLIFILLKNRGNIFSVAPEPYDYVRLNWENVHVIVFEVVEVLQLIALVFSLEWLPMAGSDFLYEYSNYLLFNFASFEVKFSLTVAAFLVWFVICGAPIILENILEEFNEGKCASNAGWRLVMSLFSNTLFLSIIEGLCGLVACDYSLCINGTDANTTCYTSTLLDEPNTLCWVGEHRGIALFSLWGLFWYTTTSIMYGTEYGEVDSPDVDIKFSPVYNTMINFLKALMIGAVVLISANIDVVLVFLLVLSLVAVMLTLFFKRIVGYTWCNSVVVSYFRVASFVILAFTVATAFLAKHLNDSKSYIPLIVFLVSSFGTLLVACIASLFRKKQTLTEKQRQQFRNYILTLEQRLTKDKFMLSSWKNKRNQWRRLVRSVYHAQKYDRNLSPEVWQGIELQAANNYTLPSAVPLDFEAQQSNVLTTVVTPEAQNALETTHDYTAPPSDSPPGSVVQPSSASSHSKHKSTSFLHTRAQSKDCRVDSNSSITDIVASQSDIISIMPEQYAGAYDLNSFLEIKAHDRHNLEVDEHKDDALTMGQLQCNGKHLLLFLERSIRFSAFSFSFVSQMPLWRQAVRGSNWNGLLHCVQVLERALTGNYYEPTELDISLSDQSISPGCLGADPDNEIPPHFTPEPRDPESIKRISDTVREKALEDVQRLCPDEATWSAVFEKVLPTIPVIRNWNLVEESNNFELLLRRSCQATVVDVGPKGIKLAKGAVIVLPKRLKGVLFENRLRFEKHYEPTGKKGPVSVAVSEIEILKIGDKVYLTSNGKKINVEKAIDSLKSMKWS